MNEIKFCAKISHSIYTKGMSNIIEFENHIMGYTIQNRKLYLVFCGTDDISDWMDNISLWVNDGFHAGFNSAANLFKLSIENIVNSYKDKYDEIITTGHSLGGAVAQIVAHWYSCRVIAFSSPRICPRWRLKTVRGVMYYLDGDIVPYAPRITFKHAVGMKVKVLDFDGNSFQAHKIENMIKALEYL